MDMNLGDLPNNILKFRYGINYKYIGKVSHSFDRFYIVLCNVNLIALRFLVK